MLAAYQPWFGKPSHIDVGYSSQDRVDIEQQIEKAKQLGISAFVVNWYGARHDFEDKAYTLMQRRRPTRTSRSPSCMTKTKAIPRARPTR